MTQQDEEKKGADVEETPKNSKSWKRKDEERKWRQVFVRYLTDEQEMPERRKGRKQLS